MDFFGDQTAFYVRYLHVVSGVMWIGLLWYFNFVQMPVMSKMPNELKPAVGKHIAPEALFWFRWGAASTVFFGLWLMFINGYGHEAMTLNGDQNTVLIGIGMWMGLIMAFNVWFIIWPNQKIALGLIDAPADAKPAAARKAMLLSRTNTLLSIPMLFCMVSYQNF